MTTGATSQSSSNVTHFIARSGRHKRSLNYRVCFLRTGSFLRDSRRRDMSMHDTGIQTDPGGIMPNQPVSQTCVFYVTQNASGTFFPCCTQRPVHLYQLWPNNSARVRSPVRVIVFTTRMKLRSIKLMGAASTTLLTPKRQIEVKSVLTKVSWVENGFLFVVALFCFANTRT